MSRKAKKDKGGRPKKITPDVLQKLEDAFSNAFPDREACLYAGISNQTLYNYQKRNPKFIERKEALKLSPNLTARTAIVKSLGDPQHAWRWLEKKDPELRPTSKIEHSGKIQTETMEVTTQVAEAVREYEEKRTKQIEDEARALRK